MTLTQILEVALPLLASIVTALVQQDRLPNWANALIEVAVLVAAGFATAYTGDTLTGNPRADIAVIVASTLALQSLPYFQPYFNFIRNNILVIAPKTPLPSPPTQATVATITPTTAGKQGDTTTPAG